MQKQTSLSYRWSTFQVTRKSHILNSHTGENEIRFPTKIVKCYLAKAAIPQDSLSVSLTLLWSPLHLLSWPWVSHILLGGESSSEEVKVNNRLLNRALCRFRYAIMSPCFSTMSSRLEIVLQTIRILTGCTNSPILIGLFANGSLIVFSTAYCICDSFLRYFKPRQYPKIRFFH